MRKVQPNFSILSMLKNYLLFVKLRGEDFDILRGYIREDRIYGENGNDRTYEGSYGVIVD